MLPSALTSVQKWNHWTMSACAILSVNGPNEDPQFVEKKMPLIFKFTKVVIQTTSVCSLILLSHWCAVDIMTSLTCSWRHSLVHAVEVVEGHDDVLDVTHTQHDLHVDGADLTLEELHREVRLHQALLVWKDTVITHVLHALTDRRSLVQFPLTSCKTLHPHVL